MGKVTGFLEHKRKDPDKEPVKVRLEHYREFEQPVHQRDLSIQGARCMDCGVPFCNTGCPLGNLIPDWNDHVYQGQMNEAVEALHLTNNFPEVTGRVCPAPCEAACVLGINDDPVSIKLIEHAIADYALENSLLEPRPAKKRTFKRVAIVGSGPAGLAAAQQLARAGHSVVVFERDDKIGGLLQYGIPDFKMEKWLIDRRVAQMAAEGVDFKTNCNVGVDPTTSELKRDFDAIVLAIGSRVPRDLPIGGRELDGIHFAMDFLTQQNRRVAGLEVEESEILATDKHVIVLGGGDTGSDCVGTSHRQHAKSVTSFEIMPRPPDQASSTTPWPHWPLMFRSSSSHDEGGERDFGVSTVRFTGEGRVQALECVRVEFRDGRFEPVPGSEFSVPADLVLLAMGFIHPEKSAIVEELGVALDARGNVKIAGNFMSSVPGVFAAGDCQRGQSLVVWAIADGRKTACGVDEYLMGRTELATGNLADPRFTV